MSYSHVSKILLAGVTAALLLLAAGSTPVRADDFQCTRAIGAITVDNLNVPPNAVCTLTGTRVDGNLKVSSGATLYAYGVSVQGKLQAKDFARLELHPGAYIREDIQLESGGPALLSAVRAGGNLQAFKNWGGQSYAGSTIGGDLQAFDNRGGVSVRDNTISGNLQCKGNSPLPVGGNNLVAGAAQDQCANLQPAEPTPVPTPTPTETANVAPTSTQAPDAAARLDAVEDRYSLTENQLVVEAPGILANDQINVKDPVSLILVRQPQHGSLILGARGDFSYQAVSGYYGQDRFDYYLSSGKFISDPAPVYLSILDRIAPGVRWVAPVQADQRYDLLPGEQVRLEAEASDNDRVAKVEFFLWDYVAQRNVTLASLSQPPYAVVVDAGQLNPLWNQVRVVATDPSGNLSPYASIWLYKVSNVERRVYLPAIGN